MRTPREIYAAYDIMPNLQLHQLRVAAVGKLLCDNFKESVNTNDVILACLFHDMGNIVKFKLENPPAALGSDDAEHWRKIQKEVIEKYGPDQHEVSEAIAREIPLPEQIATMIGGSGYSQIPDILRHGTWESKLLKYADLRVAPYGVVSLQERFQDFAHRYQEPEGGVEREAGEELERKIFDHTALKPEDITDAAVAPLVEELWEYPVS
jgi:hypothetical protein